jgi:hypothetical protein
MGQGPQGYRPGTVSCLAEEQALVAAELRLIDDPGSIGALGVHEELVKSCPH